MNKNLLEKMTSISDKMDGKIISAKCSCGVDFIIGIDRSVDWGSNYLHRIDRFSIICSSCGKNYG